MRSPLFIRVLAWLCLWIIGNGVLILIGVMPPWLALLKGAVPLAKLLAAVYFVMETVNDIRELRGR